MSWPGPGHILAMSWPCLGKSVGVPRDPWGSLGSLGGPPGSLGGAKQRFAGPKHDTLSEISLSTMNFGFEHRVLHHSAHRMQRARPKTSLSGQKIKNRQKSRKNKNFRILKILQIFRPDGLRPASGRPTENRPKIHRKSTENRPGGLHLDGTMRKGLHLDGTPCMGAAG